MNRKPKLLPSYATVHPAEVQWKNPIVLQTFGNMVPFEYTECAFDNEASWLEHVRNNFESETIGKDSNLSWGAYHASKYDDENKPLCSMTLLPLFEEKSSTVSMIQHSMKVVKSATDYLNPGQTIVVCMWR